MYLSSWVSMLHFNGYSSKCLLSPKSVCCQLLQSSGISRCFRSVDVFAVETFDFNKKKCFKRYILRIFNPLAKKSAFSHSFANILYLWIQQGFHAPQFIQSYFSRKKTKKHAMPHILDVFFQQQQQQQQNFTFRCFGPLSSTAPFLKNFQWHQMLPDLLHDAGNVGSRIH